MYVVAFSYDMPSSFPTCRNQHALRRTQLHLRYEKAILTGNDPPLAQHFRDPMASTKPPPNDDDAWNLLESGLKRIMSDPKNGVDLKLYMKLYTEIHTLCAPRKASNKDRRLDYKSEEVYTYLNAFLEQHIRNSVLDEITKHLGNEKLPAAYVSQWDRYLAAAKYNDHLFEFLNRHWVKRERDEGRKDIFSVYELHMIRWREGMSEDLRKEVLEKTQGDQKRQIVNSLVAVGLLKEEEGVEEEDWEIVQKDDAN